LHDLPGPAFGAPWLSFSGIRFRNLKNLDVRIPLRRMVCVTGVSGSGKSTLVKDIIYPSLAARMQGGVGEVKASDRLDSAESETGDSEASETRQALSTVRVQGQDKVARAVFVDQSILAKTPRSTPAVYVGALDDLRDLFALSPMAREKGFTAGMFSFNSARGQCERCRGAGFEKIEMQFLSDVYIRCPDCAGQRYRSHVLEIKISPGAAASPPGGRGRGRASSARDSDPPRAWSIADFLEASVDEAIEFLTTFDQVRPVKQAVAKLRLIQEVGLGYLKLGQPINTLSGGESQRLKLVRELAHSGAGAAQPATLFLFDEPTTGLHFEDVRVLLRVFRRLVQAGHSVLIIEHNLEVIRAADWVIDLGPEAGEAGGEIVAEGPPSHIAAHPNSHTGAALREREENLCFVSA
jgi:excinuclease ABC subunit A